MVNSVRINEAGYIEIHPIGNLGLDETKEISIEVSKLATQIKDRSEKSYILTDLTNLITVSPLAFGLSRAAIKDIEFDKIACYGANPIVGGFVQTVLAIVSGKKRAGVFETRTEAIAWLEEIN